MLVHTPPPATEGSMQLLLWRHAHAADGHPDNNRRLTEKGRSQARKMADWLRGVLPDDARVLVSPAVRTQETAAALRRPFAVDPALGTGALPQDLLAAAGWPDAGGTVLLVGHQPTLGETAAVLLTGEPAEWRVRKGALWWLERSAPGLPPFIRTVIDPRFL